MDERRRPEPSPDGSMREGKDGGGAAGGPGRGAGVAAHAPPGRRHRRSGGETPADGVRPFLRLGKAASGHATREIASTASAATPTQSTRSPAVANHHGVCAGVAALTGPATRLRHHAAGAVPTAERSYAVRYLR